MRNKKELNKIPVPPVTFNLESLLEDHKDKYDTQIFSWRLDLGMGNKGGASRALSHANRNRIIVRLIERILELEKPSKRKNILTHEIKKDQKIGFVK